MGQFKPMVKMETTEPSVILKLKKGGHVKNPKMKAEDNGTGYKKMADGGTMGMLASTPALVGRPAVNAPVRAPGKPSMAARRKAMRATAPAMKKGGGAKKMAMGGMPPRDIGTGSNPNPRTPLPQAINKPGMGSMPPRDIGTGAGPRRPLAQATDMPRPRGGPLPQAIDMPRPMMKKGGKVHEDVAQDRAMIKKAMAGKKFATGGVVMGQGGYKTGGVAKGNAGGYAKGGGIEGNVSGTPAGVSNTKTGGVKLGNAGGFRKGGAAKKFADGGAVQDDGRAVKMPQGNKRPSTPVSINQLSGTFKKGGKVKKFSTGGLGETEQRLLREAQEEKLDRKGREAYENSRNTSRELEEAMNPMSMAGEMFSKVKKMFSPSEVKVPKGSVTKTEKSVTVAPKKRGGAC